MTAIELVNLWQRQQRIDPRLYELLVRRLTIPPPSHYAFSIAGISAGQLTKMITTGEISRVRGIGQSRLAQLRRLVRPHHAALYVDVLQMVAWGTRVTTPKFEKFGLLSDESEGLNF